MNTNLCLSCFGRTSCKISPYLPHLLDHLTDLFFVRTKLPFYLCRLGLQFHVLIVADDEGRVAHNCTKEFLFCNLFDVREAQFGE